MKLFFSQNSPYARRPRLVLHEANLRNQVEEVDLTPRAENEAVLFANGPGGKVPALMTDTGAFIVESLLICRYLDDLSGNCLLTVGVPQGSAVLSLQEREREECLRFLCHFLSEAGGRAKW